MKQKVISYKNLAPYFPTSFTILAYLLLDKFNASGWVWGVVGSFFFLWWLGVILVRHNSEPVDIFEDKKKEGRNQNI